MSSDFSPSSTTISFEKASEEEIDFSLGGEDLEVQDEDGLFSFDGDDLADDNVNTKGGEKRPQHSPFATEIVSLRFSPNQTLRLPRQFLDHTPLASRLARRKPPHTLEFGSIRFDAGHVIVNYLVTGRYECLRPWGGTPSEKYASEFRTALRVCEAAESLDLIELNRQAQEEVERVGDNLNFPQIVDNVDFLDPFHQHLPWIGEYIQSRMVSFWENITVDQATEMVSDITGPSNLHKILIGGMLKIKASGWPLDQESTPGRNQDIQGAVPAVRTPQNQMLHWPSQSLYGKPAPSFGDGGWNTWPESMALGGVKAVPAMKTLEEVEAEAIYEESEMVWLLSRKEEGLAISDFEEQRLRVIKDNADKRAQVLMAGENYKLVKRKDEKAQFEFQLAGHEEDIFTDICAYSAPIMENIILFRALRRKYHSEKLETMEQRHTASERYQPAFSVLVDPSQEPSPETSAGEGSPCPSLSSGGKTPESDGGLFTAEVCWSPESHLRVGGAWRQCPKCTGLVREAIRDLVQQPELDMPAEESQVVPTNVPLF